MLCDLHSSLVDVLGGHGDEWEGINSGRGQGGFTQTYAYLVNNAKFASLDPFVDWYDDVIIITPDFICDFFMFMFLIGFA